MEKKLYKVNEGKMIDGVCGGIAEYFDIDVSLVRIGWVVIGLLYGVGLIGYIIAAIILPRKPASYSNVINSNVESKEEEKKDEKNDDPIEEKK